MITFSNVQEKSKRCSDISEHLILLYDLTVALSKDKIVVELGVRKGESTTALLAAVNDSGGKLYSIDIQDCRVYTNEYNWEFIQGDDMHIVKSWNIKIDHLFIDTSHTYEHTLAELRAWGSFVKHCGIITLHDTESFPDVLKAIKEFLAENMEYSFQNLPICNGLGLLRKNKVRIIR